MSTREKPPIQLTTIWRSLDRKTPTNRAIIILFILTLAAGTAALATQGVPLNEAAARALSLAGAIFFGWALARETDPDRWYSAFFGAAGAGVGSFFLGGPDFLLLFWFMIAMRFINRSTGDAPGILDFSAYYGIKVWLGFSTHWTIPLLTLPTMLFAGLERFPRWVRILLTSMLPVAGIVFGFLHRWRFEINTSEAFILLVIVGGVAILSLPVIWSYKTVRSVGDRTGKPLEPHRVQWTITWAVGAGLILTFGTQATLRDLAPLWAALLGGFVGLAIESVIRQFRPRGDRQRTKTKITRKKNAPKKITRKN